MKKIFLALLVLAVSFTATAQTAQEIYKTYVTKTGIDKFMDSRDGRSSMVEVEIGVGPVTISSKVTSKYPSMHRIELDVQGQTALVIVRDTVAYLNAMGKSQTFTGAEQIRQVAPVVDLIKDVIPSVDLSKCTLTLLPQEGKGKGLLNVVECVETAKTENNKTILYFNAETGLLDKTINEVKGEDGKMMKIEVSLKKYTSYDDGSLLLPSSITTKLPGQAISITIRNFELDFPTASWMFAAPKK